MALTYLDLILIIISLVTTKQLVNSEELGGRYSGEKIVSKASSPHQVSSDLVVLPESSVVIEPGTELRFDPGVKLLVHGTLTAVGTSNERIKFTKSAGGDVTDTPINWPSTIRLANGSDIHEGVVQILYNDVWRGICANSANWTAQDAKVVCRQLGFASPVNNYFTYNFTATDYHKYLAITQPNCTGEESRLLDCDGAATLRYSSQICRDQRSLYLKCQGIRPDLVQGHWGGIHFYNTTFERRISPGIGLNESTSLLSYADVLYAGVTDEGLPTAAISASPYVPKLSNVRVKFSAYDAINYTDINSTAIIDNCEVSHSRGHGLNVTTSFGRVRITGSSFHHNMGNGMYVRTVDKIYRRWEWRTGDFCLSSTASLYPQIYTAVAPAGSRQCAKTFKTVFGNFLTISLLEVATDPIVKDAQLQIYNGNCLSSGSGCPSIQAPLLKTWHLKNLESGTIGLPQAEVSTTHQITVNFSLDAIYREAECVQVRGCVRFVFLVTSTQGAPAEDVILSQVISSDNNLHGVLIENPRSFVKVTDSQFSRNQYGGGFRIRGGACDLDMSNTVLEDNSNSGINITYSGGRRVLRNVVSRRNKGIGIYIDYIHEFKTREERHQKSELVNVKLEDNSDIGLRVGNYCANSLLVINESSVISRNGKEGVHVLSCYGVASGLTNFSMEFSTLSANAYQAIKVSPILSMIGIIKNMTFTSHSKGVLLIDNTADLQRNRAFLDKYVDYSIESNLFKENTGPYVVNLRLTQTQAQNLIFRYNRLIDNSITFSGTILKPRSRARAVVVISSSNIKLNRNELVNPASQLELATHSTDTAISINATLNWWGSASGASIITDSSAYHERIVGKILDQEVRYNLASIDFYPALKSNNLDDQQDSRDGNKDPREFERLVNGTKHLGGKLKSNFVSEPDTVYIVDSDVNIPSSKEFKLSPGTKLQFDNTVGVLVKGKIYAVGSSEQPIIMNGRVEMEPQANLSWIRFTEGENEFEGVLELNLTGEWSTVCNKGWTMREASIVCQQFGYTLLPNSWIVKRPQAYNRAQAILYNHVRCMESDSDIRDCIHDGDGDFNDCTHEDDVAMKCVPPTWAGVKIVATATKSELSHVTIEEAGLLDYFTNEYVPALQVDKNYHYFSDLTITKSTSTGMSILYSEPFGLETPDISLINNISRSTFSHNLGDGLSTRSSYLTLIDCVFTGNSQSGFSYDPSIPLLTAFDVRKAIPSETVTSIDQSLDNTRIQISTVGEVKYLQAMNTGGVEKYNIMFEIQAAAVDQRVTIQVLDYSPETYIERLVIYDGDKTKIGSATVTAIEEDNVDLPLISSSDTLTLKYSVNGTKSGRLMLSVSSQAEDSVRDTAGTVPQNIRATIRLQNCESSNNKRGLLLKHYNNPSNENMDLFTRVKYEQVVLDQVTVTGNTEEAIFVPSLTKYNEVFMPTVELIEQSHRMANITYKIYNSTFTSNGRGIVAEHNHVDFSNNMWRWKFVDNLIEDNRWGGLLIELPLILHPYDNGNHSVEVNQSRFVNNKDFGFVISGGFANLSIFRNSFDNNVAYKGLIELNGTEKAMFISENEIINNRGKFMLEIDISSHSEFGVHHLASVYKNRFQANQPISSQITNSNSVDTENLDYTMALRGVQQVNTTHNIFADGYKHTFIADVSSSSLQASVNVEENYWSTNNQSVIREKIVDFHDRNNYAVALYSPFLVSADFNSQVSSQPLEVVLFSLKRPLGGIISESVTIPYRAAPYEVVSDITVPSGVTLNIEPGVTFHIHPNIGFLVLGRLLANGLSKKVISFLPVEKTPVSQSGRVKRQEPSLSPPNITSADGLCRQTAIKGLRLCGGEDNKEGFIQLYNDTINAWSLVCDPQFNDRTAEVFCRSMGHYPGNVAVRYSELYEYFTFGVDRNLYKDMWTRTFLCKGHESDLHECALKINYNLETCRQKRQFVFMRCGERNLDKKYDYWGNIRFATDSLEAASDDSIARSALRNVRIVGAGVLHGERVSAVISTYHTPSTYNIDIRDCAAGGLDFISPQSDIFLLNSQIQNNLKTAVNVLILNGRKGSGDSTFKALNSSSVPYDVYGMINICDARKVIDVRRRVLVYYKYNFDDIVNCVKVFRSVQKTKVHIRFLQVNLFHDDFSRNSLEIFDGPDFVDSALIKDIRAKSGGLNKLYATTQYFDVEFQQYQPQFMMGLHLHASPAGGAHGFIAEITPSSSSYAVAEAVHKIIGNKFYKNAGGALRYSTVGEKNPGIVVTGNVFKMNGLDILNLTSSENVLLEAQNVKALSVSNNMFGENNGSCTVWLNADVDSSQVDRGNISNNIFHKTINGEALRVYGNFFQKLKILFNYVVDNVVENLNTVDLRDVIVNVTGNTVFRNKGAHGIDLWSTNDITSSKQIVEYNQFYSNYPGDKFQQSQHGGNNTMLYSAGHYTSKQIHNNWFENSFYFEMSTHNRTGPSEKPFRDPTMRVDAMYNYWGHKIGVDNTEEIIQSRMHDYRDDTNLSMINYDGFYADNISLPQMEGSFETGYCLVGWQLTNSQKCYKYFGGIATYEEAEALCALEKSTIAQPYNQFWVDIGEVVKSTQQDYSEQVRAWVDEPEKLRPKDKCSVVIDSRYDEADCGDRLPFVCESDQIGAVPADPDLLVLWVMLGVGGFLLLLAAIFVIMWFCKAKVRKEQRFERRASLRSSIRSNKYAINNGALTQGSQTNLASSLYGSRNALANRPMARGRNTTRDMTHSIALTDFTVGETDADFDADDSETVMTQKNGYTSTGYAGSVDSSRRGSRDDLSDISRPIRAYDPVTSQENSQTVRHEAGPSQAPPVIAARGAQSTAEPGASYSRYRPTAPVRVDYSNEGYSTDHSSPKHTLSSPRQPTNEDFRSGAVQPAPRGVTASSDADEHAYINTGRLQRPPPLSEPEPQAYQPAMDLAELKRRQLYSQKRPSRPAPPATRQPSASSRSGSVPNFPIPPKYSTEQLPPSYNTATRGDALPQPRQRPVSQYYPRDGKLDSLSTMDTKSVDSFDTDYSVSKPPLSYRPYDHHRQYSDEKKPLDTDLDSTYSEDQADRTPLYRPRTSLAPQAGYRHPYHPSPLVRDINTGYDSDVSSPRVYHHQNSVNEQYERFPPGRFGEGRLPPETDIDAMSEMTDDWDQRGPPVETDF